MPMEERLEQAELDTLWLPGDPIASAERLAAAAAEPDRPEVVRAELETQRARALGAQGRRAEAEALLESLEPAAGVLEVRVLLERGRLRLAGGRLIEAIPVLEAALRAARRDADAFLAIDATLVLAEADQAHADQWIEEGLSELSGTDDPRTRRWGVALHERRGWTRLAEGDAPAAVESFRLAFEFARAFGTDDLRFAAEWALARCLRELGRPSEALEIQRRLAAERPEEPAVAAELAALTAQDGASTGAAADETSSEEAHTIDS